MHLASLPVKIWSRAGFVGMDLTGNYNSVKVRVDAAVRRKKPTSVRLPPTLVAVSKTKPPELIVQVYELGQRHFGENYVQELVEKASNPLILDKCADIQWHFIGNLQRNKVKKLLACPRLWMVETVDSVKLADELQKECEKTQRVETLHVFVQVNTSGEANKGGCEPEALENLVYHIRDDCSLLRFSGLMTIGSADNSRQSSERLNPDFETLVECRRRLALSLNFDEFEIELSMGMSDDFEQAIEMGSTNVRVGSLVFGGRQPNINVNDTGAAVEQKA